jgi:hypothetical protein
LVLRSAYRDKKVVGVFCTFFVATSVWKSLLEPLINL